MFRLNSGLLHLDYLESSGPGCLDVVVEGLEEHTDLEFISVDSGNVTLELLVAKGEVARLVARGLVESEDLSIYGVLVSDAAIIIT